MAVLSGRATSFGRNVPGFAGENVATGNCAAEKNFRMERIWRGVARFTARTQTLPIAIGNLGMNAARGSANCAAILLRTGDPVRETIVSGEVIDLCGWLVVPGTPCNCAVHADDCSLVAGYNHSFRIVRIYPELMIVLSAGCTLDRGPRLARVRRAICRRVHYVEDICILWIDTDLLEIPATIPKSWVAREPGPGCAGVMRNKYATFLRIYDSIESTAI